MKKMLLILVIFTLAVPAMSFAAGTGAIPDIVSLSNNVSGKYFTDATSDATEYSLSTGHAQGNRAFHSSNSDSQIFYTEFDVAFDSATHLITGHVPSFESDANYTNSL